MGFLSRRRSPPPPPPAPPAPAIQPPIEPATAVKSETTSKQDTPGGVPRTPTMKTSARGVMSDAPLQYASLLGRSRSMGGRMM